jgi:hypothetical protein
VRQEELAVPFVFAYVDPGSASLIAQALIAGIVAIPILLRGKIVAATRAARRALSRSRQESPAQDPSRR